MRLNEVTYTDAVPVDGYGPGFFRVAGEVHTGGMAILPTGLIGWNGFDDIDALTGAQDFDVLLVGTGAEIAHIPAPFRDTLEGAGIGVEVMASPQACRTYNVLLGEGRRVALVVLPV